MGGSTVTVYGAYCGDCGERFVNVLFSNGAVKSFPAPLKANVLRQRRSEDSPVCDRCESAHILYRMSPIGDEEED